LTEKWDLGYWERLSGAVTEGGHGGPCPPPLLRPVGKLSMLSEIVKVVEGGGGGFKMSSSGKNFVLSENVFGLSEKYCPCPPPPLKKYGTHGATGVTATNVEMGKPIPL
jgi:hypothetical protein